MVHRLGNGTRIDDIEAARQSWREAGRSPATFCSKAEYEAWQEDHGELVEEFADGTEVRRHATLRATSRGGNRKIVHNRVIIGNPTAFANWQADPRPESKKGWYPQWTYYPDRDLEHVLDQARKGIRRRPIGVKCIETGKPFDIPKGKA
jgi:hypothetical protein